MCSFKSRIEFGFSVLLFLWSVNFLVLLSLSSVWQTEGLRMLSKRVWDSYQDSVQFGGRNLYLFFTSSHCHVPHFFPYCWNLFQEAPYASRAVRSVNFLSFYVIVYDLSKTERVKGCFRSVYYSNQDSAQFEGRKLYMVLGITVMCHISAIFLELIPGGTLCLLGSCIQEWPVSCLLAKTLNAFLPRTNQKTVGRRPCMSGIESILSVWCVSLLVNSLFLLYNRLWSVKSWEGIRMLFKSVRIWPAQCSIRLQYMFLGLSHCNAPNFCHIPGVDSWRHPMPSGTLYLRSLNMSLSRKFSWSILDLFLELNLRTNEKTVGRRSYTSGIELVLSA